jgi:hypothetical protein
VILAGGNDISQTDKLTQVVAAYKDVVTEAKKCCNKIIISSIPPRIRPQDFVEKAECLNAELRGLAEYNDCDFINHLHTFYLPSGVINNGYFYHDMIHPNLQSTNKLGEAIGLECIRVEHYLPKMPPKRKTIIISITHSL